MHRVWFTSALVLALTPALPSVTLAQRSPSFQGFATRSIPPRDRYEIPGQPSNPYGETSQGPQPYQFQSPQPNGPPSAEAYQAYEPQQPYSDPSQPQISTATCVPYDGTPACTFAIPSSSYLPAGSACHCDASTGATR
jgi:hypothetical protein